MQNFQDLRRTDPGYAGAGIYTTIQAESAIFPWG